MSEGEKTTSGHQTNAGHVRSEFGSWLGSAWDPELPLLDWRQRLVDSGWAVPSWPTRWHGRDLPAWADRVVGEELGRRGVVGPPIGPGMRLAAPTLLTHGADRLKGDLLRDTLVGAATWCQLFSEPGAGSDLAGLTTRAERDGDEWVVNGQKVWTTSAHHADFGMLLARTDWDAPKHEGLSYFALPMDQPGVEVRPIVQMNEYTSFNEVFLTDARIPHVNTVGTPGEGWAVARTTLAHERQFATLRRPNYSEQVKGRTVREADTEAAELFATYVWYPQRAGRADLAVSRAQQAGVNQEPVVRQEIARLISLVRANTWSAARARAARRLGRPPGPEGSIGKLAASEVARRSARVHTLISGARAMLTEGAGDHDETIAEVLVSTPAQSIAGGTDEIQRNIIGEKILGLPREPSVERGLAFRDVNRAHQDGE